MSAVEAAQENSPIVVGVDGSESSIAALRWAAHYASLTGGRLVAITTWDWPTSFGWSVPIPADFNPEEGAGKALEESVKTVKGDFPDVPIEERIEKGHPAPVLVEASRSASLVVVGSRGHGEFAGMLLGSVSEHCVTNSHCPVLVIRDGS